MDAGVAITRVNPASALKFGSCGMVVSHSRPGSLLVVVAVLVVVVLSHFLGVLRYRTGIGY